MIRDFHPDIRPVSYADWLFSEQAQLLIREYADECSIAEIGTANPQPEAYAAMEASGMFHSFAAYHQGRLVGFANLLTPVLPHYGVRVATVETLFVGKDFRSTSAGLDLRRALEDHAAAAGCVGILYSAPAGGQLERLLEASRHYYKTNSVFYRGLHESCAA